MSDRRLEMHKASVKGYLEDLARDTGKELVRFGDDWYWVEVTKMVESDDGTMVPEDTNTHTTDDGPDICTDGGADGSSRPPIGGSMDLIKDNKLVCSDCGETVQLHMTTRHTLFAQCDCEWARVEDITDMENHVWWPKEYVTEGRVNNE